MKTVLITGASRGIGSGIVKELAKTSLNIIIGYNKNKLFAEELVNEHKSTNNQLTAVQVELENTSGFQSIINDISQAFGGIDILINNAAIHKTNNFLDITEEEWDHVLSVNLKAAFLLSQKVIPGMLSEKFGRIINIASIAAQRGGVNSIPYAASKAGLVNLTRSLARLYSQDGIHSFCIAPGLVETDMSQKVNFEKEIENIPIKRLGTKEEIGALIRFLISESSEYLTGQTFHMNGGEHFYG